VNNELIINSTPSEVVIALLHDKRLVELNREKSDNNYNVGDIYLGRVKKVMTGLNAAFVDVGYEKDGFLHYLDLGPQAGSVNNFTKQVLSGKQKHSNLMYYKLESDIKKDGKIGNVVSSNQQVLVQIAKEPISTKGPRITTSISLAGRYIVLVPFTERISVSQKIRTNEEKNRLKRLIASIKPKNFGVIIRTVAEGKSVADLDADLNDLVKKWEECFAELKTSRPPHRVLGEIDRTSAILRDLLNASFNSIHINDPELFEDLRAYVKTIAPDKEKILKLYKGEAPIFDHFGVDRQIKGLFGKTVTMKSGGYLIIEHTEALHVIDINSGNRTKSGDNQETNALDVNLESAVEVARQLRLRDMGGIIVIDFIDLHIPANRKLLYEKMKSEMAKDRAKHNILPPSKFGLIQITRQRVRPEMNIVTTEKCPSCGGTGEIQASIIFVDQLENKVHSILKDKSEKSLTLSVHPFIEAYLTKGIMSIRRKWFLKHGKRVKIKAVSSYHFMEYKFENKHGGEIKV